MIHHLRALLGSIAYGIRQFVGSVLSFVGLRWLARFAVPLLVVLFTVAAVVSARDTAAILASRPDVQETTLTDVANRDEADLGSIWFEFDALLDATHLEIAADAGTFFYLARDPDDPEVGLLVRSPLNDTFFRVRTVTATLTDDEAAVAGAADALGALPSGFSLESSRYLDETGAGGGANEALVPSQLGDAEAGSEVIVTGRVVSPATYAACATDSCDGPDAAWWYYFADPEGAAAIVLRSPHPPSAIPARLQGLYQRDTFDLAPVLDSEWFASIQADVPTERAFSAGRRPPITVPASWTPTILFAGAALFLLASLLAGYPVFGRSAAPGPARTLEPGDGIDLEISGRLDQGRAAISLTRSPGALERLSMPDLALRMWRYGLLPRDLSRQEAEARFVADAAGESDRLVLHERDQSAMVAFGRDGTDARVDVGRLYRVARSAPAIHLRQGATDAYLTTRSGEDRDRAASEILGEVERAG
ncbi:MAG TPA: hypothetical protein VFW95_02320 [Candidatus Limnocylindria bacterium]|nr:hypothetical protein [Candidatus Limnocylindria bacterium]